MNVLRVADNVPETEQVCAQLRHIAPRFRLHVVHTQREAVDRLAQSPGDYDLVLADLGLSEGSGLAILAHIRELDLPLVVVLLADSGDEALAVPALRMGVGGWAIKTADWVSQLPAILDGALEGFHAERTCRVQSLRILYAGDSVSDAERTRRHVESVAPYIHLDTVQSIDKAFRRLSEPSKEAYDVLLLSYRSQDRNALERWSDQCQTRAFYIPVVLVVEPGDSEIAWRAPRLGVADIVVKRAGYLDRLPMALENAFYRAQAAQGQAALRESQERYESIIELAPNGIITASLLGVVTSCNTAFLALTGFSRDEIVGRHFTRIPTLRLADIPKYVDIFRSVIQSKFANPIEFLWVHKDGRTRWGEAHISLLKGGSRATGFQAIVADTTERRRAEQLLKALNQAGLAMERALTPDEILTVVAATFSGLGMDCTVFLADEQQSNLLLRHVSYESKVLRTAERLLGLKAAEFSMPIDGAEPFRRAVREREATFVESAEEATRQLLPRPLKRSAGQLVKVLNITKFITAPLMVEDLVTGMLSVQSADLTEEDLPAITAFAHQMAAAWHRAQLFEQLRRELVERTRVEEALQGSEERFRALVQNSSDVIIVLDADGLVRYVSPSVEHALGYTADDFVGRDVFQFVHPDDLRLVRGKFVAASRQPGVPIIHEFRILHRDGSWISFETMTNNLLDVPSVQGIVVNARDTTERRRLESQFRQAQKMEAVGRLAGGIAHDFNNLLTGMQGYTTLTIDRLASDTVLDADAVRTILADLVVVQQASERAAGLTHQLLAFSRKQMLQPKVVDLNELVRGIRNMLQRLIGEDVECQTLLAPSLGCVVADPVQIEQVIMNLAVNARDAMPRGGKLMIETANVELDSGYVQGHPGSQVGPYVMLAVSDTGTGMDDNVRAHLFEPFFTTKEEGRGTGLGLATVYGIVKQSGGYIWPCSELGHGTTFKVYLPRVDTSGEPVAHETARGAVPRGTETILLVEDDGIVRELACRILERQGYTVLEAAHPQDALALCEQYTATIHMLLTDVVMPGMGGLDLSARLVPSRPEIKVLYVSGYTDEKIVRHGVLHEEVHFVQKPFTPRVLAQKVREVLDET